MITITHGGTVHPGRIKWPNGSVLTCSHCGYQGRIELSDFVAPEGGKAAVEVYHPEPDDNQITCALTCPNCSQLTFFWIPRTADVDPSIDTDNNIDTSQPDNSAVYTPAGDEWIAEKVVTCTACSNQHIVSEQDETTVATNPADSTDTTPVITMLNFNTAFMFACPNCYIKTVFRMEDFS